MSLLWILIAAVVLFFLARVLIVSYSMALIRFFVDNRHDDAEAILQTGVMPTRWLVAEGRVPRLKRPPSRRAALRRLGAIIRYFERTPLAGTEEERAARVARLKAVYETWRETPVGDLIPPELERPSG